ncbi:MAG TPA: MaoC/PaaZ C-terminal domain-containing protein [Burkholderiales bacterium]|nr:MaoC/PaaZ C-terminal domain-containing protein [Burkholderiales bacterium]
MAYSAALGEMDRGVHPLFPVCYEWPVSQPIRQIPELRELLPRLVHAEHDLRLHRLPREGDRIATRVSIAGVQKRKPGAFVVFRFESVDAAGEPVSTTDFGALYRGVDVEGPDRGEAIELPPPSNLKPIGAIEVAANLAHVYTECARIFNPIHTDVAHARKAGLPDIILHGTATLALSVSRLNIDPSCVRRIRCRFSGMVLMPSRLEVLGNGTDFETRGPRGEVVISRGRVDHD